MSNRVEAVRSKLRKIRLQSSKVKKSRVSDVSVSITLPTRDSNNYAKFNIPKTYIEDMLDKYVNDLREVAIKCKGV